MLLWRWGEAFAENTIDPFNPQNPSVDFLLIILNFILFSSAEVIHTAHEPTTTLRTSHSHPLLVMLLCTHNPSTLKVQKTPIRGGRQRSWGGPGYPSLGVTARRRSISKFSRATPVTLKPVHDHMEPHGSGEGGRGKRGWGGIRPGRQLLG